MEDTKFVDMLELAYGKNPYQPAVPEARAAAEDMLRSQPASKILTALHATGQDQALERAVLALGLREALATDEPPHKLLTSGTLPSRLSTKLPRPRLQYLRIAAAAARAEKRLASVLGDSPAMVRVRSEVWAECFGRSLEHALRLERIIRDDDLLIVGETGTGKESLAGTVLDATPGGRDCLAAPSATINAAALPETLVESELFGFTKGAFTGATQDRAGRIRSADGGSFFLDEIGDLPLPTQVKMLRVIEADELMPLGSDTVHQVDVRFIAATHRDLEAMVDDGSFRRDLYQRLAGHVIRVPPLRERPEDIESIGIAMTHNLLKDTGAEALADEVLTWLRSEEVRRYSWPGNVRELQNVIRSRLLGFQPALGSGAIEAPAAEQERLPPSLKHCSATWRDVEDWYLKRVLNFTERNYAQTARILNVDRSTVRRRANDLDT